MDRNAQIIYGNKIKAILKKEVSSSFTLKHQSPSGGGVDVVVITTGDVQLTNKLKSFLWKDLSISVGKINGHGNVKTTLLVNISELEQKSFDRINEEYSILFPEGDGEELLDEESSQNIVCEAVSIKATPDLVDVLFDNKSQAFDKLKEIYINQTLFDKLSPSHKNRVKDILKDDLRKDTERLLEYLLSQEQNLWTEADKILEISAIAEKESFLESNWRKQATEYLLRNLTEREPDKMVDILLKKFF